MEEIQNIINNYEKDLENMRNTLYTSGIQQDDFMWTRGYIKCLYRVISDLEMLNKNN